MTITDPITAEAETLDDVLTKLSSVPVQEAPDHLPVPRAITGKQRADLTAFRQVYGKVRPEIVRALNDYEILALIEEFQAIDAVIKMATSAKEDIRISVFNHFDKLDDVEGVTYEVDRLGHHLTARKAAIADSEKAFTREIRTTAPVLKAESLYELVEAGSLTEEEYLAMTVVPDRIVDEGATLEVLKNKPELMAVVAQALTPGKRTGAFFLRNK